MVSRAEQTRVDRASFQILQKLWRRACTDGTETWASWVGNKEGWWSSEHSNGDIIVTELVRALLAYSIQEELSLFRHRRNVQVRINLLYLCPLVWGRIRTHTEHTTHKFWGAFLTNLKNFHIRNIDSVCMLYRDCSDFCNLRTAQGIYPCIKINLINHFFILFYIPISEASVCTVLILIPTNNSLDLFEPLLIGQPHRPFYEWH